MSSDPATAYNQGVNEANLAVDRLAALGLTGPDKTGSIVYYDIEAYGTNQSCRAAVNSFMNGWVSQMRARGNLAGFYGSTVCSRGLSDFLTLSNVPMRYGPPGGITTWDLDITIPVPVSGTWEAASQILPGPAISASGSMKAIIMNPGEASPSTLTVMCRTGLWQSPMAIPLSARWSGRTPTRPVPAPM